MTTTANGTDTLELLRRAVDRVDRLVAGIHEPQWSDPTPCSGWTVRDLVNHVTVEDLWAVELFGGRTIAEVGDRLDGDRLGAVPAAQWRRASRGALDAAAAGLDRTVHLGAGDAAGSEYAMQLFADHLVHGWDLAVALGHPAALDPADAQVALDWFAGVEELYRAAGMIGPRLLTAPGADAGTRLLAAFGRTAAPEPEAVVERFNAAFNEHDVTAVMALMTDDCVFEGTAPPDGRRYAGAAAVRGAWEELFASSPDARFEAEETIACGDRVVVRWCYRWGPGGSGGHVRGVDVFRIADGLVAEKLAYVKG
jgi:uncharacterized protein (TIGR03086 family)